MFLCRIRIYAPRTQRHIQTFKHTDSQTRTHPSIHTLCCTYAHCTHTNIKRHVHKKKIRICPPIWYEQTSGSWTIKCDLLLDIKVRYFIIIFVWLLICQLLRNIIAHSKPIFSPDPWWPGLELNKTARKKPQYWTARIDDDDDIFSYKATCLILITLQ